MSSFKAFTLLCITLSMFEIVKTEKITCTGSYTASLAPYSPITYTDNKDKLHRVFCYTIDARLVSCVDKKGNDVLEAISKTSVTAVRAKFNYEEQCVESCGNEAYRWMEWNERFKQISHSARIKLTPIYTEYNKFVSLSVAKFQCSLFIRSRVKTQ